MDQITRRVLTYFKEHIAGFAILLVVIGAGLILVGEFYVGWWALAAGKLGIAVFTGGIFSVFFKAIQASGVFKDELAEIVFFDETYLRARSDIETIWGNVTRALYKNPFPGIEAKIGNIVKNLYLPSKQEFYYPSLHREYLISWYDQERGLVKIDIHSSGTICPKRDLNNINLKLAYRANLIEGLDIDQFSISEIMLGNENIYNTKHLQKSNQEDSGELLWIYESSVPLDRQTEIVTKKAIVQDINTDQRHDIKVETYVDSLKVEIVYPHASMGVEFHGLGLAFESFGIERDGVIKRECKDLIFGHQGYMFTFIKR